MESQATELSERDECDYSIVSGTIFSLSVAIEYCEAVQIVFQDRKANYMANKAKDLENQMHKVNTVLLREFTKKLSPDEKAQALGAIEQQKQLIYSFFMMI